MSSLPKQQHIPVPSSSSSKQSAFRAPNTSTPPVASSRPRPIGQRHDAEYTQPGDDGASTLRADEAAPEGQIEAEVAAAEAENQPPTFKPLFTLIEDSNSSDYHHPTVHYIFSDDDTDLITEASLRVLETGQVSPPAQNNTQHGGSTSYNDDASEMRNQQSSSSNLEMDGRRPSVLPPPIPGVKERFILLDVEQTATLGGGGASSAPDAALAGTSAGTTNTIMSTSPAQRQPPAQPTGAAAAGATPFGYRIASAHSLTSDWQVLGASFSPAPTFDTPQQQQEATNSDQANTLMLRIEGTAGFPRDIPLPSAGKDAREQQTLEEMMDQFDKRMAELRQVIEANGDYSPAAAAAAAATGLDDEDHDNDNFDNNNDDDDDNDKGHGDADDNGSSPPGRVQQREETRGKECDEVAAAAAGLEE